MRGSLVALAVFALMFAGCAQDANPARSRPVNVAEMAAAELVPGIRALVAQATVHEVPTGDLMPPSEGIRGPSRWEPRDAVFSFHGIHLAFDEWGRQVPAFVFRYVAMRQVLANLTFDEQGMHADAHFEPETGEYLFDAADGRALGVVDLKGESRSFRSPEGRSPFTGGYEGMLMVGMAIQRLHGDLTGRIPIHGGNVTFVATSERPLESDCTAYALNVVRDQPAESAPQKENSRTLFCLPDDSMVPLWTFRGTNSTHLTLQRSPGPFPLPDLQGEILPPMRYAREAWGQAAEQAAVGPMLVPASHGPADWASLLADRVDALATSPGYLAYHAKHPSLYLTQGVAGFPSMGAPLPVQLPGLPTYDEESWLMTSEGKGMYWGFVHGSHANSTGPAPRYMADVQGAEFDSSQLQYPAVDDLPPLAPIGEVQKNFPQAAPATPAFLTFLVWPTFDGFDLGDDQVMWFALGSCFGPSDGTVPYGIVSGMSGALLGAGHVQQTATGCSAGGGSFDVDTPSGPARLLLKDGLPVLRLADGRFATAEITGHAQVGGLGTVASPTRGV